MREDQIITQEYLEYYPPNLSAASEFLDRTEGKVTEKHEHTGKDGGAIQLSHDMDIEALKKAIDSLDNRYGNQDGLQKIETIKKAV